MADPASVEEWLSLARQHQVAAEMMANNREAAAQGHLHAGFAVECALKAYIMRRERLNAWPSKEARPDLYTHNLRALKEVAGIEVGPRDATAASWLVALQWDRNQGYDPERMPRKVARSMVEAAFGANGVVSWIRLILI